MQQQVDSKDGTELAAQAQAREAEPVARDEREGETAQSEAQTTQTQVSRSNPPPSGGTKPAGSEAGGTRTGGSKSEVSKSDVARSEVPQSDVSQSDVSLSEATLDGAPAAAPAEDAETPPLNPPVNPLSAKPRGRLMTFKAPQPAPGLIKALSPVNRWLTLGGIPGLRNVPGIGALPGVSGLMNIPSIDFPAEDEHRLAAALHKSNATFITPNHPEFFTDWMLDKEVLSRVAPLAACWATHGVVNGMGGLAQSFWLKNNLIAQIPGAAGAEGKAHSIRWALAGKGVLLHPEGQVGWHGDLIAKLFPGAIDMAKEAAEAKRGKGAPGKAIVAPVIWKLVFQGDVAAGLARELAYVEDRLELPQWTGGDNLAARLLKAYDLLLARDEAAFGQHPSAAPYFSRQEALGAKLRGLIARGLDGLGLAPAETNGDSSGDDLLRLARRWLRHADRTTNDAKAMRELVAAFDRVQRFRAEFYPDSEMTQEHIAESIKRLRNDYCFGTRRDAMNKFLPRPVGPRRALIRVPEPMDISLLGAETPSGVLTEDLQRRMQMTLDDINQELRAAGRFVTYPNPFVVGRA